MTVQNLLNLLKKEIPHPEKTELFFSVSGIEEDVELEIDYIDITNADVCIRFK